MKTKDNHVQPNYLIKNIEELQKAAKEGSLPCFMGNMNTKGEIIIKPYTINNAISNLPISGLNQIEIQRGFQIYESKDIFAISEKEAKNAGTEIDNPEKGYIAISKRNLKGKYCIEKLYPLSKVKDVAKVKEYSKKYISNKNNKSNIKLPRNDEFKIDCTKVKDFNDFWGKYKTAAAAKGTLICSPKAIETARNSLYTKLNYIKENADYEKTISIGKELDKSYQKELRLAFPRDVPERERGPEREKRHERNLEIGGIDI